MKCPKCGENVEPLIKRGPGPLVWVCALCGHEVEVGKDES